jgi:hypothetical protein
MARSLSIGALLFTVLLFVAVSRSDSGSGSSSSGSGSSSTPVPTPVHHPFTMYDSGTPAAQWPASAAEQAALNKALGSTDWDAVEAGFAGASAQLAQVAQQQAAQLQIGLEGLATAGVIQ